jgi:DNA-binding XRE family transcriptional regulator
MDKAKRKRLEAKGWRVGTAAEFLGLAPEESAYVELKVALGGKLKDLRNRKRLSQVELAKRIGSSQSRVAKIEAADPSVSLDLLVRSLIALGATRKDLARVIAMPAPRTAA